MTMRDLDFYLEKVAELGIRLGDPRPLAEWAMGAKAVNYGNGGVIVAADGTLVADVGRTEGTNSTPGGEYVRLILTDRISDTDASVYILHKEVGLALGACRQCMGQHVHYVRYWDVATGHTQSSMTSAWDTSAAVASKTDEQWTTGDVARFIGVDKATVRGYKSRGQMPPPDGLLGTTPWWKPETVRVWHEQRRGQGWRKNS